MKHIDSALMDSLIKQAKESPRQRAHFNFHPELNDPVQRLCMAIEPGATCDLTGTPILKRGKCS